MSILYLLVLLLIISLLYLYPLFQIMSHLRLLSTQINLFISRLSHSFFSILLLSNIFLSQFDLTLNSTLYIFTIGTKMWDSIHILALPRSQGKDLSRCFPRWSHSSRVQSRSLALPPASNFLVRFHIVNSSILNLENSKKIHLILPNAIPKKISSIRHSIARDSCSSLIFTVQDFKTMHAFFQKL